MLSALLEIDHHGRRRRAGFVRGVIRSAERMTYTNVHLFWKATPSCASATRDWCAASN